MKVYPYIVKARQRDDGMYPIYIVISRAKGRITFNSGLVTKTLFEGNIFPRTEKNSRLKTEALTRMLDEIEAVVLANHKAGNKELKELVQQKVFSKKKEGTTLIEYMKQRMQLQNKVSSHNAYMNTISHIKRYDPHADLDITPKWLDGFREELGKTLSHNTITVYMRTIRSTFNWAIKEGYTDNDPFRRVSFKMNIKPTRKRSLSPEEIKDIINAPVKKRQEMARDFFALSFYLIGANSIDLLSAKPDQIVNGRFEYIRSKTGKPYSIKIEPEAMELIEKYRGKKLLLCFGEVKPGRKFELYALGALRHIRKGLTVYWARHSWATIAYELGISMDVISDSLGHSHGAPVTNIYIRVDYRKVDEANRKVIDRVLKGTEPTTQT